MDRTWLKDMAADLIAAAHIGYFVYVVGGTVALVAGVAHRRQWIRNPWFRLSHLAAVYIVVLENVFNLACPLNTAEWQLRSASQSAAEASSGVGGLLDQLLFQTIPGSILNLMYSALAVVLLVALLLVPPRLPFKSKAAQ